MTGTVRFNVTRLSQAPDGWRYVRSEDGEWYGIPPHAYAIDGWVVGYKLRALLARYQ